MTEYQAGAEGLGGMGKILRMEGEDSKVAAMLYRKVIQEVLLFGS